MTGERKMRRGIAKVQVHVRLTLPNFDNICRYARKRGISFNWAVNRMLERNTKTTRGEQHA